jgi:tetratricopeptide (TPR) repeat protein
MGRYAAARDRLLPLIARNPDAGGRAVQLRILSNIHVELGDAQAALESAEQAVALNAAPDGADLPYARQAHARALALSGDRGAALTEIDAVIRGFLDAGSAADSFEVLRAQRYRAEFLQALGRGEEALRALRELRQRHESAGASPVERGQMLDSLGEAERLAGQPAAARSAHEAARKALASQLTEAHPLMVRNSALLDGANRKLLGER